MRTLRKNIGGSNACVLESAKPVPTVTSITAEFAEIVQKSMRFMEIKKLVCQLGIRKSHP
jgi:hypothetical protein